MADLPKHSEAKSKVAHTRPRVNGRFVGTKTKTAKKEAKVREEEYQITQEDREKFGSDSKAFFEWALTKAATRYEAAKYAKELMRFQYPALQSTEINQEIDITTKVYRWEWEPQLLEATTTNLIEEHNETT